MSVIGSMKRIYLVRHGETLANRELYLPKHDEPLSDAGLRQAETLKDRFAHIELDQAIVSGLYRAQQTAIPTAELKGLELTINPVFNEFHEPTRFEGLSYSDPVVEAYRTERNAKHDSDPDWTLEDGETFTEFAERIQSAKRTLETTDGENILVVSHAYFIKAFITGLIWNSYEPSSRWLQAMETVRTTNTGITVFAIDETGRWFAETINDKYHFAE